LIKEEFKYAGMPLEKIEELIQEKFDNRFKRKILKFLVGRKEYKINQEIDNFKTGANLLVEQYFNFEEIYSTTEFNKIHHEDFIIKTMTRVLDKYLNNGEL
jgi:DNA-binding transcriptional MerR regulator